MLFGAARCCLCFRSFHRRGVCHTGLPARLGAVEEFHPFEARNSMADVHNQIARGELEEAVDGPRFHLACAASGVAGNDPSYHFPMKQVLAAKNDHSLTALTE